MNTTQSQDIYLSHVFEIPFISLCHITDMTSIAEQNYDIYSDDAIITFRSNVGKVEHILRTFVEFLNKNNPEIKDEDVLGVKKDIQELLIRLGIEVGEELNAGKPELMLKTL